MFEYPIDIKADDNGTFVVTFPDVPEAITQGETIGEAVEHAKEALEVALSFYVDEGKPLPKASRIGTQLYAYPSTQGTLKLAIYKAMKDGNVSKTELSRKMDVALMTIDRILDVTHKSHIEQLEAALEALGQRFTLQTAEEPLKEMIMKRAARLKAAQTGNRIKVGGNVVRVRKSAVGMKAIMVTRRGSVLKANEMHRRTKSASAKTHKKQG